MGGYFTKGSNWLQLRPPKTRCLSLVASCSSPSPPRGEGRGEGEKQNYLLNAILLIRTLDLTQTQLAERINAKQKSISRYETGASLPSIRTLVKIAKVLQKPAGYFLDE